MLKLKEEVPFEELEKYGFKKSEVQRCYVVSAELNKPRSVYDNVPCDISVWESDRTIQLGYSILSYGFNKMLNKLYDLITAGLVEKVDSK